MPTTYRFFGTSADETISWDPWTPMSPSVSAWKWEASGGHYRLDYDFGSGTFKPVWVPLEVDVSPYSGRPTSRTDYIFARGGDDIIDGGGGSDVIYGQGGDDTIVSRKGDRINPGSGDNTVRVIGGEYTEFGTANGRTMIFSDPSDYLDFREVNADLFIVAYDQDILDEFHGGEAGLYHPQMTHAIFGGFDTLTTGSGDDVIYGDRGYKAYRTGDGDDTLYLAGGVESVVDMGAGNDTVSARGDERFLLEGDESRGAASYDNLNVNLGTGDDTYFGSDGTDLFIFGFEGNDLLFGGAGGDNLFGDQNNDRLFGEDDDDQLEGGAGRDVLVGGNGQDLLHGNAGRDTFLFDYARESRPGADQHDKIVAGSGGLIVGTDYGIAFDNPGAAAGDVIDVSRIDANWTGAGDTSDQAFTFGGRGVGHIWTVEDGSGNTLVRAENNSERGVDFEILIEDGEEVAASDYSAADFIL
ncbi:calcium-binding protein [Amaricoccus macauensis]|uniref:calcium-binding protein n=1 Tax=Amaricoccus macauensis TaxID=57001 RepID=UPI003C7ACF9A